VDPLGPVTVLTIQIYRLNFFTGFIVSGGVYYILCRFFPVKAQNPVGRWMEVGDYDDPSLVYGADDDTTAGPTSSATERPVDGDKKWWSIRNRNF
jgi:hypothetical protein